MDTFTYVKPFSAIDNDRHNVHVKYVQLLFRGQNHTMQTQNMNNWWQANLLHIYRLVKANIMRGKSQVIYSNIWMTCWTYHQTYPGLVRVDTYQKACHLRSQKHFDLLSHTPGCGSKRSCHAGRFCQLSLSRCQARTCIAGSMHVSTFGFWWT